MRIAKSIRSNLLFLLAEARTQLKVLRILFEGSEDNSARILGRSGFTQNLNTRIQDSCTTAIAQDGASIALRATTAIANELHHLTELCRDCVDPWHDLSDEQRSKLTAYPPLLRQVSKGINTIEQALPSNNSNLAIKLGALAHQLSDACQQMEARHTDRLHRHKQPQAQVGGLLIARTIGAMGSALLNISEALLSSNLGQPIDMPRFRALQGTLNAVDANSATDFSIAAVADGKSGGNIASVRYFNSDNNSKLVIFKDGARDKLKEEQQGIQRWQRVAPGIAPEVFTYKKQGDSAAMLIEHLQGITFEKIVLQSSPKLRADAMKALQSTLLSVWAATQKKRNCSAHFARQTQKRLADLYAVHPHFRNSTTTICGVKAHSFANLLKQADQLEQSIVTPFTVLAHGDFNVDNILFDPQSRRINFIDLHRAAQMDFVQDVSVFMVSNYRLQVFSTSVRRRIRKQVRDIYTMARTFAESHHDSSFELRLALGLARSFATSTRFIADRALAQHMFLRAHYLLEQITQNPPSENYRIPIKELFNE
ncbi:MAG: phosphotransferase [Mariprofundales bacterium]